MLRLQTLDPPGIVHFRRDLRENHLNSFIPKMMMSLSRVSQWSEKYIYPQNSASSYRFFVLFVLKCPNALIISCMHAAWEWGKFCKVLKISAGAYIFEKALFEGLIYRGKFAFKNWLGYPYSWKEIYRFCFVLLCIWGQYF